MIEPMKKTLTLFILVVLPMFVTAQYFGTSTHPMNKNTQNIDILKYWDGNTPEELKLYESAYSILSEKRDSDFEDLATNIGFMKLCEEYQVRILGGPILGNVSSNGVSIWVRSLTPSKIVVESSDGKGTFRSLPAYSHFNSDLAAIVKLEDLKPSTSYTYKLIINDTIEVSNENYAFRTLPSETETSQVRIAFGSCPHRWGLGNKQLFKRIYSRDPDAMLLIGDIAVQDRENHIGKHRADYLMRDFQPAWRNFVCGMPVYTSWDDHDYFNNDDAGIPEGYTLKDKENVCRVFQQNWNNPTYGIGEEGKGIFLRTRIGPADVIMTDNRYFRTGEKGSFLGEKQMEWLKEQLLDCKGPFIIISCGTMWSDYVSNGKDSWGVNDPEGREEIFKLIEENNIPGVLLISGDRHGARGFTIPRESGYAFYEFEAGSLGARAAAVSSLGQHDEELYGVIGVFAFGEFTFNTSKSDPEVTFRLIEEGGDVIYEKVLPLSKLTPARTLKK